MIAINGQIHVLISDEKISACLCANERLFEHRLKRNNSIILVSEKTALTVTLSLKVLNSIDNMPVLTFLGLCPINLDYRQYNVYNDLYRFLGIDSRFL